MNLKLNSLIRLNNSGGFHYLVKYLKIHFPLVKIMRKVEHTYSPFLNKDIRVAYLSIDDMTKFITYVKTNEQ